MSDEEILKQAIEMSRALSRRRFLRNAGLGAGALAVGPAVLAACGNDSTSTATSGAGSGGGKNLKISTWDAYIDVDKSGDPHYPGGTLANFTKKTGITVDYKVDYNDNDEYFNKVFLPYLGKGKPIGPDIVMPTYWMAARILDLKWIEALPIDKIPNHKNVADEFMNAAWDPGAKHNMPWQAGVTGIAYDPALTGKELTSFSDLLNPAYKGKVGMLTEMRDTIGLAMLANGADPSKVDMAAANKALDQIEKAKSDGQIRAFTGNEYLTSLESGDFVACMAWSGDIVQLQKSKPNIKFVIPEAGGMKWYDTMIIPNGATNTNSAAAWMDYVYDPVNAAKITAFVQYLSPVKGVRDELVKMGGESAALADNPILFPDEATAKRLFIFASLKSADELELQNRFNKITGA